MRSAHHNQTNHSQQPGGARLGQKLRLGRLAAALCCGSLAMGLMGCQTLNPLEWKSFIDPGEMGRYKQEPLFAKIVDHVDAKVEEPDSEFVNAVEPTQADLLNVVNDYRISKNDLLTIEITELTGPGTQNVKTTRVTESGNISLPYLDTPIHAEGLSENQLEQTIVERYRHENIIQKAQVSVMIAEARGRAFSILGQVTRPGQYVIVDPDFRVLDALTQAGDQTSPLLEDLYIIRKVQPSTATAAPSSPEAPSAPAAPSTAPADLTPRGLAPDPAQAEPALAQVSPDEQAARDRHVIHLSALADPTDTAPAGAGPATQPTTVDPLAPGATAPAVAPAPAPAGGFDGFHDLTPPTDTKIIHIPLGRLRNGDLQYNIVIKPHDQIIVQPLPTGVYYVGGHVLNPGAYTLSGQRVTLKEAIISAHMLDQLAIPQRTDIIRRLGPGKEVFVRVDLDKIFAGHESDIYLKPNDSIMVGTNFVAPFLSAVRGAFRITYGFGFLYDRNFAVNSSTGAVE